MKKTNIYLIFFVSIFTSCTNSESTNEQKTKTDSILPKLSEQIIDSTKSEINSTTKSLEITEQRAGNLWLDSSITQISRNFSNVSKELGLFGDEHFIFTIKDNKNILYAYSWNKKTIEGIKILSDNYFFLKKFHIGSSIKELKELGKFEKYYEPEAELSGLFVVFEKYKNIYFYFNENVIPYGDFEPDLSANIPDTAKIIGIALVKEKYN